MSHEQAMAVIFTITGIGLLLSGGIFWLLASEPNS